MQNTDSCCNPTATTCLFQFSLLPSSPRHAHRLHQANAHIQPQASTDIGTVSQSPLFPPCRPKPTSQRRATEDPLFCWSAKAGRAGCHFPRVGRAKTVTYPRPASSIQHCSPRSSSVPLQLSRSGKVGFHGPWTNAAAPCRFTLQQRIVSLK